MTEDLGKNSLGRTYCLWELARANGWETAIVSTRGDGIWPPLQESEFAADCLRVSSGELAETIMNFAPELVVALKPLAASFGLAMNVCAELGIRVLLDIDDPDLEGVLSWQSPPRRIKRAVVATGLVRSASQMRALSRSVPKIVSNPYLQSRHGGELIPHIRQDRGPGADHTSSNPRIAFIGSLRPHKGIDILRAAVARMQRHHVSLVVTGDPPSDPMPWETWIGTTSMDAGLDILSNSDIVLLPSLDRAQARGQLPVKLVDAMLAGRAIAVSDIAPMPWALGSGGLTLRPGSVDSVAGAIEQFVDPHVRQRAGVAARRRALELFTVEANIETFRRVCMRAVVP